jgi:glycosyltransferase involved in cell wall biosynthesis
MRILFVHQNLPAQFRHLLGTLADTPDVQVIGIRQAKDFPPLGYPEKFPLLQYPQPQGPGSATHHYLKGFEGQIRRGQAIVRVCLDLKKKGFIPDVIFAHPGWGESLFLKDVFPDAHLVGYLEYYYRGSGGDVGFDPEFPSQLDDLFRLRIKNSHLLHDLAACDEVLAPTHWQARQAPAVFLPKIRVMHDGIRTDIVKPNPSAVFQLPDGRRLTRQNKVLTYVARNLEPYRGFHIFMRALPAILAADKEVEVVIVGGDEVSYGAAPKAPYTSYREKMLVELGNRLDLTRVHFVGKIPYQNYLSLLQISTLHVYLTYPFVLSWSLLEAMAAGCQVLASATPPVAEVVTDAETGFLVDFFDHRAFAARAVELLDGDGSPMICRQARELVVRDMDYCDVIRHRWLEWLGLPDAQR